MIIRNATINDLDEITKIEETCFPEAEAATRESFQQRLINYANHFYVLEIDGKIVSFVNGLVSDEKDLLDEMYEDASYHKEEGSWQMIFGVDTLPECQRKGYAGKVLTYMISEARNQKRKGVVLTCKDYMISYYAKFGFVNEGISSSTHGDVAWHQMRFTF